MPSHYAHYRLGRQVRLELTPDAAEVVGRWPSLYLIGLHGRTFCSITGATAKTR